MQVQWKTKEDPDTLRSGEVLGISRAYPEARNSYWLLLVMRDDGALVSVGTKAYPLEYATHLEITP